MPSPIDCDLPSSAGAECLSSRAQQDVQNRVSLRPRFHEQPDARALGDRRRFRGFGLLAAEYKVNLRGCEDVKAWARQWDRLKGPFVTPGSANAALEAITVQFTEAGTTRSQKPNRSSLAQVRTNELLQTKPWELREFRLSSDGYLAQDTVKQTPDLSFGQSALLRSYAQTNRVAIIGDDYTFRIRSPALRSSAATRQFRATTLAVGRRKQFSSGRSVRLRQQ